MTSSKTFSANSPVSGEFPAHKGQWRGALIISLICARINDWVNNRGAGDLGRYRAHHDVIVMERVFFIEISQKFVLKGPVDNNQSLV